MANAMEHTHGPLGHEKREADVKLVLQTLVVLAVSVALCCIIVYGMFVLFKSTLRGRGERLNPGGPPMMTAPTPRLQVHPADELKALNGHEDEILDQYGWVDKNAGIVHIPIEKAIEEVAATLPVRPSQPPKQQAAGKQQAAAQKQATVQKQEGGASGVRQ